MRCWQDDSVDEGPKHDDLNLMDPHGGERKPAPAGCPLTSMAYATLSPLNRHLRSPGRWACGCSGCE